MEFWIVQGGRMTAFRSDDGSAVTCTTPEGAQYVVRDGEVLVNALPFNGWRVMSQSDYDAWATTDWRGSGE